MKALVLKEYNKLVYEDVPEPAVGADKVLIRVKVCGICGSDVHGLDGSTGRRIPPLIMGHEAAGVVAEVGGKVGDLKAGERVTFDSTIYCGECDYCLKGEVNLCDNRRVIGVSCDEYRQDGAFAEYVAVPRRCVYRIPDSLSFEAASTVEPLSVAVHAVGRVNLSQDHTAVVIGAGMIGLLIVQVLKARGCGFVFVVDLDQERLKLAVELGADEGFNPEKEDIPAKVLTRTGNRGADLAFDAVGLSSTFQTALGSLSKGGSLVLVGNFSPDIEMPLQKTVVREISIYGSCASAGEYPECLEILYSGAVRADKLISASAPLSEGAAWFDRLYRGEKGLIKVCLLP